MIRSRLNAVPPTVTISPPLGERANAAIVRSVSETGLNHGELADPRASRGIPNDRRPRHVGRDLLEQLHPFSSEAVFEFAAGPSQAFDEARADRFDDLHEHDRDCAGCLLDDLWRRFTPKCGDYGDLSLY